MDTNPTIITPQDRNRAAFYLAVGEHLPRTTVKLLNSSLKNEDSDKLTMALRRASLHDAKIGAVIEAQEFAFKREEAMLLHSELRGLSDQVNPNKRLRFTMFMRELEAIPSGDLAKLKCWVSEAEQRITAYLKKRREAGLAQNHKDGVGAISYV